jgi:hypothetical protein
MPFHIRSFGAPVWISSIFWLQWHWRAFVSNLVILRSRIKARLASLREDPAPEGTLRNTGIREHNIDVVVEADRFGCLPGSPVAALSERAAFNIQAPGFPFAPPWAEVRYAFGVSPAGYLRTLRVTTTEMGSIPAAKGEPGTGVKAPLEPTM